MEYITLCKNLPEFGDSRIDIQLDFDMRVRLIVRPAALLDSKDVAAWAEEMTIENLQQYTSWGTFVSTGIAMRLEDILGIGIEEREIKLLLSKIKANLESGKTQILYAPPSDLKPMKQSEFVGLFCRYHALSEDDMFEFIEEALKVNNSRVEIDSGLLSIYFGSKPVVSFSLVEGSATIINANGLQIPSLFSRQKKRAPSGYFFADPALLFSNIADVLSVLKVSTNS